MIYDTLAKYYDDLVKDDEATVHWVNLIKAHINKTSLLEVACGSGEITIALAKHGYQMEASDLSSAMIEEAKKKKGAEKILFFTMDMLAFTVDKNYDGILCLCDSINYLLDQDQLLRFFTQVYDHLNKEGVFIFDMHTMDRLVEFKEEFYEEGSVKGNEYTWSIISEEDCLYHNFIFYDEHANAIQEQHIQRVYAPKTIEKLLSFYFTFDVYTDFKYQGIQTGEKHFYVCRKRGSV